MVRRPEPKGPGLSALSVIQCAVHQSYAARNLINRFHVYTSLFPSGTMVQDVANTVRTAWKNNILPQQDNHLTLTSVVAQDLSNNAGPVAQATGSDLGGHTVGSEQVPISTAIVASWPIPLHYRGGHPRSYFAGLIYADIADPLHFTTTAQTAWQTAAAGFRTAVNAGTSGSATFTLGSLQRFQNYSFVNPPVFHAYGVPVVHAKVYSQRRRLGKGI